MKKIIIKNPTTVFSSLGVVGFVATTVSAVKATTTAVKLMDEALYYKNLDVEDVKDEVPLTKKEIFKTTWKCYVPTAILGGFSITSIFYANKISIRNAAVLSTAYSLSEKAAKDYRNKVIETIGDKKAETIDSAVAKKQIEENKYDDGIVEKTGCGTYLCLDTLNGRYFRSDIDTVKQAVNRVNAKLMNELHITLNDLYDELNLRHTELGWDLGWDFYAHGMIDVRYSTELASNGEPCLVLNYSVAPVGGKHW